MGFDNYLTSYKLHLLKHVRGVFTFNDTSALTEAEIKAYVHQLTHESAIPIPTETFEWFAQYFKYVREKGQMFVYDNLAGLWHYENEDTLLRNMLTDYFTIVASEAKKHNDKIFFRYAKTFFAPSKIPNIAKRMRNAQLYTVNTAAELVRETENLRYFETTNNKRALLDLSKDKFNLKSVTYKDTQPLHLQHMAPVPIAVTNDPPKLWLSLIETYMMNDPERIAYFKKVLAYMMSPYNYNQVLLYFIGEGGRNGKGTVTKVLQDILGTHAIRMNAELLNAHPQSSFKKDDALAATEGRSLLIFNEVDERMEVSTQNVKDLTEGGRDKFGNKIMTVVRPAYSKNYEVNICGTPLIIANSLLNFGDWSALDPVFKRLILVPFDYVIEKEDPTILDRLAKEYPKIQAWLYMNYFAHKDIRLKEVPKPDAFQKRFVQYRADSDIIRLFFEDCIEVTMSTSDEMLRSDLYRMYKHYCKANGRKAIKNKGTNGFANLIKPYLHKMKVVLKNGQYYVQFAKPTPYYEKEISFE